MAAPARSFFTTTIIRNISRNMRLQVLLDKSFSSASLSSTEGVASDQSSTPKASNLYEDDVVWNKWDDLRTRIFSLRLPKRSVTNVLERYVSEGKDITISDLRSILTELKKSKRFKHALEISEWMVSHDDFEMIDSDFALRIDLVNKVFGTVQAQSIFDALPSELKTRETYTAMLHCYVATRIVESAEALYAIMKSEKLELEAVTYNELMTLYMWVEQSEKVPQVIEEMKSNNVAFDLFTYNLWISSSAVALEIDEIRKILQEMSSSSSSDASWKRYVELVNIYLASGLLVNSGQGSIIETGKGLSQGGYITYDLLIILYGGFGDKDKLDQLWKSMSTSKQKLIFRNYACIIASYLLLDHLKEVREIIGQWKQSAAIDYDDSVCNRLKNAFAENGMSERAEALEAILSEQP